MPISQDRHSPSIKSFRTPIQHDSVVIRDPGFDFVVRNYRWISLEFRNEEKKENPLAFNYEGKNKELTIGFIF